MLSHEEKLERIELIDAVCDAGRLARGLDQLLESLAHADQLDPLDVEGILVLRSISERCAERIGDAVPPFYHISSIIDMIFPVSYKKHALRKKGAPYVFFHIRNAFFRHFFQGLVILIQTGSFSHRTHSQ